MSQANYTPMASCSKFDPAFEDESQRKKDSLTKLIETASRKLKFLQVCGKGIITPLKPLVGVLIESSSLRCQPPCQNINFKSLSPLGARDCLENILRIRRYNEFLRRNLLKSFVKAISHERRPRHRLCQTRGETVAGNDGSDVLKRQPCPELNVKKLRYQLANERKVFNRFAIGRFSHKIRNRIKGESLKGQLGGASYQCLSYEEVVSQCRDDAIHLQISPSKSDVLRSSHCLDVKPAVLESKVPARVRPTLDESYSSMGMLHSLEKLNLSPGKCGRIVVAELPDISEQTQHKASIDFTFDNDDMSAWFKNASMDGRIDKTNLLKKHNDKCGLEFDKLNGLGCKLVHSPKREVDENDSFINLQLCASRLDLSSEDDLRNLTSKLTLDSTESVCKMTCVDERQNQDYESRRRSVQWNSEVDVIYYAGDIDGGEVVRRKIEPLRKEADQQARRNSFIQLVLNKNFISVFDVYKFRDPRVTVFHK